MTPTNPPRDPETKIPTIPPKATAAPSIENGSHYVRDAAFAEDASRIRKNPDIVARLRSFAYNLIRAEGGSNIRNARWRAALDINLILEMPHLH